MSLVGTRGEPPEAVADNPPWERLFLEVKPGLSGLWLVGRAGDLPIASDEEYDFYYLRNRSLLLDIVILIRTLPALWRTERMVD
jgi:lipopolysaccharide/colanic/teichoic acid biosynthesis glycosyltransferase